METPTRRRMLEAAIGGTAGLVLGPPLARFGMAHAQDAGRSATGQRAGAAIASQRLGEGLHLLTVDQTHVVAQTGPEGVVLVDGASAAASEALLAAVAGLPSSGPVHTLFNTHWHPEQTGSNERLGRAGATIIAQENTRLWLTTDITYPWDGQHFEPLPEIAQPNETFFDDGELDTGARYGYLRHAAHTDGDLYVYFPEADVLVAGDAASGAGWPVVDWWTGGWMGGIVGTHELLVALSGAETRIVPARGRILTRADLEKQLEMYNVIYERLVALLNSGRGPDEAVEARPTQEFDAQMGPSDVFVRRAFESLWAYLSPDARLETRRDETRRVARNSREQLDSSV